MTNTVKQQILAIRATGETNMFDVNRVQHIANRKGYYELVVYLEDHRKEYPHGERALNMQISTLQTCFLRRVE